MGNCFSLLVLIALLLTATLIYGKKICFDFRCQQLNTIGYAFSYMQIYSLGTLFVQPHARYERLYHRSGLCQNKYDNGPSSERRLISFSTPFLSLWLPFGRSGRRHRHCDIPGCLGCLGALFLSSKNVYSNCAFKIFFCPQTLSFPVLPPRPLSFCHAGHGERPFRLFQFLAFCSTEAILLSAQ